MQSRIMELASQREFYIAINTKLQQTLTDNNLVRLPNGVQPIATGPGSGATGAVGVALGGATGAVGAGGGDGLHPQHQAQAMAAISSGPALPPGATREGMPSASGGMYEEEPRMQLEEDGSRVVLENSGNAMSGALLMDDERMSVSSTAIPKEAQDSLLHAHFSSMQRGPPTASGEGSSGRRGKSSSLHAAGLGDHGGRIPTELKHDPMLSSVAEPPNHQRSSGGGGGATGGAGGGGRAGGAYGGHPRHSAHDQQLMMNSSNNVMLSSGFSHGSGVSGSGRHSHHHHDQERHAATTELLSSSHQLLVGSSAAGSADRLATPPNNEGGTTPSLNEVTHVTAAVQRPIASFGSPLNDTSPMLSSAVGHPQSSNNVYFHHNPSS